jgi:hypothetical protein
VCQGLDTFSAADGHLRSGHVGSLDGVDTGLLLLMWRASTVVVVVASLAHAAWSATWVVHVAITIVILVVV